ncbi:flagellin [Polycyclovorans algicola]|uniref:flagellin n=1 Tax=Polycyclovorans algicola TaxID=616992 RepID=UPI0004A7855C|nr:flagellin [Polycyclovorans algicola]
MQVINTNVMSLNAQRNLSGSSDALATSLQRLSSGLRINSAKDDAAGLAIANRFTTQIRGMDQAGRNANDAISMTQTAEGALVEVSNNLQRIRELAVQSRNATNSQTDRDALNAEATQLLSEINRVAEQTSFNGVKLLDGSFSNQSFQIGADVGQTIDVTSIVDATTANLGSYGRATVTSAVSTGFANALAAGDVTINGVDLGAIDAAASASERSEQMMSAINKTSGESGVYAIKDTSNTISLVSTTDDIVIAGAAAALTADTGLTAATTARATTTGISTVDISSVAGADAAMQAMDSALQVINSTRADLGALQNRFSSVVSTLQTSSENLSSSRSRIMDTDFAKETASLTRAQILQQAGTAMLSQANSAPQGVLSLLR